MPTLNEIYSRHVSPGSAPTANDVVTQTKEQFLAKYADALDSQGRFIPGKANLWFDGEKASDVYDRLIGNQSYEVTWGNPREGNTRTVTEFRPEVNMDWIEDTRQTPWENFSEVAGKGALATAAILGGQALLGTGGLGGVGGFGAGGSGGALGSGTAAGSTAATAFGGSSPAWMTGANAVGAGDLTLASMPQVTASSLGGAAGGALGAGTVMSQLPQVTVTAAKNAIPSLSQASGITGAVGGLSNIAGPGDPGWGMDLGTDPYTPNKTPGVFDTASKFLTENPLLTKVGGAVLGAALGGQDSTVSSQKDPWAPAQPYLKENLARNAAMQDYYAKNPFSTEQKTAYQGLLNTLANNQANAPVMQGIANSFMGSNRGLLGGVPQFTQGATAPVIDWSKYANIGMRG